MSTIVTRAGKGSPLTHTEVDTNFTNLNTDKLQSGNTAASLTITSADINGGTIDGTAIGSSSASTGAFTTLSATGVATVSAGSVSAPAITTSGDTNTGIFFPAADTIAITEGGTEVVRINSSSNVGIGTTSPATKLDVNGTVTATSVNSQNTFGFKNRIINGAMVIDQRNAGASVSLSGIAVTYTLDRWAIRNDTDAIVSVQQSTTAPTGFNNSLLYTVTTADTSLGVSQNYSVQQRIEGFNIADLGWGTANAKTVTLSFWVRSSLTGTFGGAISNSAANRSYPFTYTISVANTFEQKTVTIAGDTSGTWLTTNGIGAYIYLSTGAGTTVSGTAGAWAGADYRSATGATSVVGTNGATFYITGVQLEKGTTATSFDYRPYGTELALCQRYYSAGRILGGTYLYNSNTNALDRFVTSQRPPVDMRTAPTVVLTANTAGTYTMALTSATSLAIQKVGAFDVLTDASYTASAEL